MKSSVVAALGAATTALAASLSTVTYVECTSALGPDVTLTSTNTITSTYCSECEGATPTPSAGETVHTTVYPVTYVNVCPTGYLTQTFTVTESCTGASASFSGPGNPSYVPDGFTTAAVPCNVCESTPVTHMATFPITQGPTAPASTPTDAAPSAGSPGAAYPTTSNGGSPTMPPSNSTGPTPFTGSGNKVAGSIAVVFASAVGLLAFLL